jgi:hypothetical protein
MEIVGDGSNIKPSGAGDVNDKKEYDIIPY